MRRLMVVTALAAALLAGCANAPPPRPQPPEPPHSGLDLAGMDRGVRVQDGLFGFTNGGWLSTAQIPPDRGEVGTFSNLAAGTEDEQHRIIEDVTRDPDRDGLGDIARKVGDMYASFMDTDRLEQLKATPLAGDFAEVEKLASPEDLLRYLGSAQHTDVSNPIGLGVGPDNRNAGVNITFANQNGLTLPDRDYYLAGDPKSVDIRQHYRGYMARMFTLAGLPNADADATTVLDLETRLARAQWTSVRNRNAGARYTRFSVGNAPGLDWPAYLTAAGVTANELVISRPGYFTNLGGLLRTVPLNDWKTYLRWHLLSDAAPYLSSEFVNARFEFVGTVLTGRTENRERWRRGVAAVNTTLGEALGQLYVKRRFTAEAKQRMDRMVATIRRAFDASIDTLDWMSPPTRAEAHDKLSKMAVKIGYPDRWRDWSGLQIRRDDLLGNLRRAAELEHRRGLDKIGKPVDRSEWSITPQTVNASYNPSRNEVTFPAGILQPPFFDAGADDAVNYGAIGSVIGHEISHGFDDRGRRYDGNGNLRDWWTPRDAKNFTTRTEALVARYNGFAPLPGTHINGSLTLGENIADLSGLSVAFKAYRATMGGRAAPVMDGYSGGQRFFLGFGRLWRSKERDESIRRGLLTDKHSPGLFRSDGVVNQLDGFYTAFDVKPGDRMYLPPEQRIRLW